MHIIAFVLSEIKLLFFIYLKKNWIFMKQNLEFCEKKRFSTE